MLKVVQGGEESDGGTAGVRSLIDEIVRDGARKMLAAALQAEVAAYVEQFADQVDEDGRRLVVRNGYHQPRTVVTSAGAVEVKAPRVNDKRTDPETGERQRFSSAIMPAWARHSPQITEVLPLLYLHGLSSGDFTFATVRLRSKVTKGPGSRTAGLAMAFKLIEAAEARWRAVNAPHLVALVRAGAVFEKGKLIERPVDSSTTKEAA
jgi:hypothetical protein